MESLIALLDSSRLTGNFQISILEHTNFRTVRKIVLFVPEASTLLQRFIGWLTGKRAEFVDSRIAATADGRQGKKSIKLYSNS